LRLARQRYWPALASPHLCPRLQDEVYQIMSGKTTAAAGVGVRTRTTPRPHTPLDPVIGSKSWCTNRQRRGQANQGR
jgi:hypothetical protein